MQRLCQNLLRVELSSCTVPNLPAYLVHSMQLGSEVTDLPPARLVICSSTVHLAAGSELLSPHRGLLFDSM